MKLKLLISVLILLGFGCTNSSDQDFENNPAKSDSRFPYLFSTENSLFMSWINSSGSRTHTLNYARYADGKWSSSHTIAADSTWFVNWADFPSIIADGNGPVAAHWLNNKPGGTYAYDVNISMADSGNWWTSPLTPHFDSTATEHGFASMITWDKDTILAIWLDGRRTADRADNEYYDIKQAMTLRGAFISTDGELLEKFLIDESVCDCCQTSLVKTDSGAIVAYRNRTGEEIRDIYTSRFDGNSWTQPKKVHNDRWEIGACPVNGPALAANNADIAVAWHTAANDTPLTKVARSTDGGDNFEDPVTVSEQKSLGRVDAAIHEDKTYISWMGKTEDGAQLNLTSVDSNKNLKTVGVSAMNQSRQSGFPQMEPLGNQLIFAWTAIDSTAPYINTKSVPLPLH